MNDKIPDIKKRIKNKLVWFSVWAATIVIILCFFPWGCYEAYHIGMPFFLFTLGIFLSYGVLSLIFIVVNYRLLLNEYRRYFD